MLGPLKLPVRSRWFPGAPGATCRTGGPGSLHRMSGGSQVFFGVEKMVISPPFDGGFNQQRWWIAPAKMVDLTSSSESILTDKHLEHLLEKIFLNLHG